MSQENVEAVRSVYAEWQKGNFRAGVDLYDPLVLFIPFREFPAARHYLRREGVSEFMRAFLAAWTNLTWPPRTSSRPEIACSLRHVGAGWERRAAPTPSSAFSMCGHSADEP